MNIKKAVISIIIISTLVLIPGFFSFSEETGQKVLVAIVQTKNPTNLNISLEEKLSQFNQQLKFLKQIANTEPAPEIIIFPEGSNFFKNIPIFLNTLQTKNFFGNLFTDPVLVIDNSRIIDKEGRFKSRTFYLHSKDGIIGWYDKQLLTPGGEYLPYSIKWIVGLVPKKTTSRLSQVRFFNRGEEVSSPISFGNIKTGALVCSDLFSPSLNRVVSGRGSNITIIQASTGIFKGNGVIVRQNMDIARLRAAEIKKPLILAANYGQSFIISSSGKVQKITQNSDPQILTGSVVLNNKKTWYGKVGDRPFAVAGFIITALLLFIRKKHE